MQKICLALRITIYIPKINLKLYERACAHLNHLEGASNCNKSDHALPNRHPYLSVMRLRLQ